MDLFDIVVARKLSGGGGGTTVEALSVTQNGTYTAPSGKAYSPVTVNVSGGSSDFSTAQMTIVNNHPDELITWEAPCFMNDPDFSCAFAHVVVGASTTSEFTVILYKGTAELYAPISGAHISISGDIEEDGAPYYFITGDCTITIS